MATIQIILLAMAGHLTSIRAEHVTGAVTVAIILWWRPSRLGHLIQYTPALALTSCLVTWSMTRHSIPCTSPAHPTLRASPIMWRTPTARTNQPNMACGTDLKVFKQRALPDTLWICIVAEVHHFYPRIECLTIVEGSFPPHHHHITLSPWDVQGAWVYHLHWPVPAPGQCYMTLAIFSWLVVDL